MWYKNNFFKIITGIILTFIAIFLLGQINFVIEPFKHVIGILFFPILISGILYYILRPIVNFIHRFRVPRSISIVIVFLGIIALITIFTIYSGAIITNQLNQFISDLPKIIESGKGTTEGIMNSKYMGLIDFEKIKLQLSVLLENSIPFLSKEIFGFFGTLTSVATTLIIVPFILFYFIRDDKIFVAQFLKILPSKYKFKIKKILKEIDNTLSAYITGQLIIALILGVLMYIAYLIIGLKYSLVLAIFVMVMCSIPLLVTTIGVIPAILVSITDRPIMALYIVITLIAVQQLEGNFIAPQLIGKSLNIHSLTLILLFLVAASMYGIIGMLIAVPVYSIVRITIIAILTMREKKEHKKESN